ncbi:MAG: ABC transporter substrate-binding protein [Alphaproteobacteria bacterium GM7ARS4]|nr:ABC transporter substrate-binding protein [Alphaproteobacteria bacterium GM7ARS4]
MIVERLFSYGLFLCLLTLSLMPTPQSMADETKGLPTLKVASLQFGTVNWHLDVIKHHQLDKAHGFHLDILPVASKNAASVALQGGAADIIVGDWFWVSRQRTSGRLFHFAPYSTASGGLVMASSSQQHGQLQELFHKRIGVAGGRIDKNWLLMRAYSLQQKGTDIEDHVDVVYGAPPLLSALLKRGEIDGVLTFWHFQARLEADDDYHTAFPMHTILTELGITPTIPINGWIFSQPWAQQNPRLLDAFLSASQQAFHIMATSDDEWQRLKPHMHAPDDKTFIRLRDGYRQGIPKEFGTEEQQATEKLFQLVATLGGTELVGKSKHISEGTFWTHGTTPEEAPSRHTP